MWADGTWLASAFTHINCKKVRCRQYKLLRADVLTCFHRRGSFEKIAPIQKILPETTTGATCWTLHGHAGVSKVMEVRAYMQSYVYVECGTELS